MSSYLLFGTHCFISHKQENNPVVLKAIFLSRVRTMSLIFPWIFHPFISSVQWLSHVRLSVTPWTEAYQAFLSITNSWILLKLMSIKSVMPSNHLILCCPLLRLILCHPLLLLPSIFPSIRVFSHKSALLIRWPKYWSFSFSISPSNKYSERISFRIDWFDLFAVQGTLKSLL